MRSQAEKRGRIAPPHVLPAIVPENMAAIGVIAVFAPFAHSAYGDRHVFVEIAANANLQLSTVFWGFVMRRFTIKLEIVHACTVKPVHSNPGLPGTWCGFIHIAEANAESRQVAVVIRRGDASPIIFRVIVLFEVAINNLALWLDLPVAVGIGIQKPRVTRFNRGRKSIAAIVFTCRPIALHPTVIPVCCNPAVDIAAKA